jgi:hypothetical protein
MHQQHYTPQPSPPPPCSAATCTTTTAQQQQQQHQPPLLFQSSATLVPDFFLIFFRNHTETSRTVHDCDPLSDPWGVGFYDMSDDANHCVDPEFKLVPAALKPLGYRSHAIGKWDVGYVLRHCLPTYRGFETFLGYYTPCTADYWLHGAPGAGAAYGPCDDVDFHDSVGTDIRGATMSGKDSLNGTYDQVAFTQRAVRHINDHAANYSDMSLYIYLAYVDHALRLLCARGSCIPHHST